MNKVLQFSKATGPKPAKELIKEAAALARPQSAECIVVAMAMRPNGVTQSEIIALFGHPHRNKLKRLLEEDKVKRFVLPDGSRSTRIRLIKK